MRPSCCFAAVSLIFAAPLAAQDAAPPAVDPPAAESPADVYGQLIESIRGGIDEAQLEESILVQLRHEMTKQDSALAHFEVMHEGTIELILEATRPVLRRHSHRLDASMIGELQALLRQRLTMDDARQAAAFYGSPLGQRLMQAIASNYSVHAIAAENLATGSDVSVAAVRADSRATTRHAAAALSPEDLTSIERDLAGKPWVQRLSLALPQMQAIRARAENEPLSEEDNAALVAVVETVMAKRMADDK